MPRHLSFFDSFRPLDALFVFVRAGDDQRRLLHNDRRGVQSVPLNGRARRAADGVFEVQDDLVRAAQLRHQRHRAAQHQKLEAAHLRGAVDRILSLLRWQLPALEQVAHDLAQKLMRVDKECHLYDDWHDQLLCAKNMHEGDMAIAFSYSGLTQEVLDCTAEAQRHNCPVVAVTKVDGSSKLATMADAVLGVAASEPLVRSGAMASRMAQLMVVDALYAAYVASDYERATYVIKQNYIEKQER